MSRLMARGCTRATAGSDTGRSTSLPQHVLDRFRVLRDDGQQHTRRRVGVRPALFQFLRVAGGKPNLVANCAWLSPIFSRTLRTSTSGTCTSVTRTLSFSPLVHAIASFNPWMMLSPTLWRFRARIAFFPAVLAVVFVVISDVLCLSRVPGHQRRDQALHGVPLGFAEVRLSVLRVRG